MLKAVDLERHYDGLAAVREFSLELRPGRIVGLVGNNGAGKTTTIKMLAGLLDPTRGTVTLEGVPTRVAATRRRIGYLPEDSPLYDDMNAVSYLRFFGSLYDVPAPEADRRGEILLDRLGLAKEWWKKPIGTLSKGMRRKVAIARCLLHDPPVLILDEPTSGLDPETQGELDVFLRELRSGTKAILLSAHNLAQVEELCDEILVMHLGRVVARGTLQDLRVAFGTNRYHVKANIAFPGSAPEGAIHGALVEDLDHVERALAEVKSAGGIVIEVESVFPSLEDIMRTIASGNHD